MIIAARLLIIVALVALILMCRRSVRKMAKASMYSYCIVALIGLMIFLGGTLLVAVLRVFGNIKNIEYINRDFFMEFFSGITSVFTSLIYVAFIPSVLFSIFLLIANIFLFIKEGRSLRNMFGIALGVVLVFGSLAIINIYVALDNVMNVHSYLGYHISIAVENIFAVFYVYFECLMLATIYVTYKAMHHKVP